MTIEPQYDNINWDDPEVAAALKRYRETIDVSSPLVKNIDKTLTQKEKKVIQTEFLTTLERFRVEL